MNSRHENRLRRVTIKEACEYGRMSRATLYRLMDEGTVRAFKQGRITLVDLNSIDEYQTKLPNYSPRRAS